MTFMETSLPAIWSRGIYDEFSYDVQAVFAPVVFDVAFSSITSFLNGVKDKEHPVVFKLEKMGDKFIAAAFVQFFPNEDPKKPGNWSIVFTFDEKDIPEDAIVRSILNPMTHPYFRSIAGDKHRFQFKSQESIIILMNSVFEYLYKWLDENAKAGEEVSIEDEGVFTARVVIEDNGEKVMAIEPDGELKVLIKDDASIEK